MKKTQMTPYQCVITALHGGRPDRIPFTVYENKIIQSSVERELRNRGLCIVRRTRSYKLLRPNVKSQIRYYTDEDGKKLIRKVFPTPYGELSTLDIDGGMTNWTVEYMFKTPDDYNALFYFVADTVIVPEYDSAAKLVSTLGEDFIVRDSLQAEPMQTILNNFMGPETFSYEWADNRDQILKLYDMLVEVNRKVYPVVAKGPLEFANYGGNVVPNIIGRDNFEKYYIPNYNEAAEILHKEGKLIGSHYDADNSLIMDMIAGTDLDYIEAYDPGMSPSIKQAQKAWPDKVLWLNWPSAWHLETVDEVKRKTIQLLEEAERTNGLIIGITEDVPEERWRGNYPAIMDGIDYYEKNRA